MPMLDIAISVTGLIYKSQPFCDCLTRLQWTHGEGMMNALTLFTGLCNNRVYCPILSREYPNRLKMVWGDNDRTLTIWLDPTIDSIKYQLGLSSKIESVNHLEAQTLLEYWASFLNQK